jgi:hypothetical protein
MILLSWPTLYVNTEGSFVGGLLWATVCLEVILGWTNHARTLYSSVNLWGALMVMVLFSKTAHILQLLQFGVLVTVLDRITCEHKIKIKGWSERGQHGIKEHMLYGLTVLSLLMLVLLRRMSIVVLLAGNVEQLSTFLFPELRVPRLCVKLAGLTLRTYTFALIVVILIYKPPSLSDFVPTVLTCCASIGYNSICALRTVLELSRAKIK